MLPLALHISLGLLCWAFAPQVLYLVCSGSEANDLALRVALAAGSLAQAETCTSSPTAQPPSIAHTSHDTHGPKARASSIIESVAGTAPLAHTAHMAHAASTSSHRSSALHSLPRTHVVVLGAAYHGHTASVLQLSPYKFWGKGGAGRAQHVHVMPCPDPYRYALVFPGAVGTWFGLVWWCSRKLVMVTLCIEMGVCSL